jgi:phage terminase large subunit-like protein
MYDEMNADKIIGETNNGGDMVESTLRTIDSEISYMGVHASRGKAIRAEPVASLSAQGRLHFVESLPELENECCSWEPDESDWSPNHMDAFVWMITYLMGKNKRKRPGVRTVSN